MVIAVGSHHYQNMNNPKIINKEFNNKNLIQKCKELIGNSKEYRLDKNNYNHLRIIGNCNRICLNENYGHLDIIGNMTHIKCVKNFGKITYTGNNGKIYLGKESKIQQINYIGNNGLLKLVNSNELKERLNIKKIIIIIIIIKDIDIDIITIFVRNRRKCDINY